MKYQVKYCPLCNRWYRVLETRTNCQSCMCKLQLSTSVTSVGIANAQLPKRGGKQ